MPLGIVSEQDFEAEVQNSCIIHKQSDRIVNKEMEIMDDGNVVITSDVVIKKIHEHGRNEGDVNVPQSLRKLIGDAATFEGRPAALQLAESFGISSPSVAAYTNPHNSSSLSESNKNDIFNVLADRKVKISKRAINKLNLAISMIDEDKLKSCKATELSSVAKDMAQITKHMEPEKTESEKKEPVQFLMYAPQINTENKYQTVIAKDNY